MKSITSCLLILSFVIPASARERTPEEQARRIPRGSRVEIELKKRQVVQGRLGEVTETQLSLEPLGSASGAVGPYLFQDISKIRSIEPKPVWLRTLEAPVVITCRALEITMLIVFCLATVWSKNSCG